MKNVVLVFLFLFPIAFNSAYAIENNIITRGTKTIIIISDESSLFRPSFGYFVANNLSLNVSFLKEKSTVENSEISLKTKSQDLNLNLRYYLPLPQTEPFLFSLNVGYGQGKMTVDDSTTDTSYLSYGIGADYLVGRNMTVGLSYVTSNGDLDLDDGESIEKYDLSSSGFSLVYKLFFD